MVKPQGPDHDAAYRALFRERALVQQFIEHFVPPPVRRALDLSRMEPVSTSFVLERLRRESDCIWKVHFRSGEPLYLLLLVEFQSSVDTYMAVRLALYVALLYDSLRSLGKEPLGGGLPPTLAFVLYNGKQPWGANRELANFYPISRRTDLQRYQLQHRYILLDLGRLAPEDFPQRPDVLSTLFQMEQASLTGQTERFGGLFDQLVELLRVHPCYLDLQRALLTFFEAVLRQRGMVLPHQSFEDFTQVKTMFHNFDDIVRERRQEGRLEGRQEGMREAVLKMLVLKFQVDPVKWGERLGEMEEAQVDVLLGRILEASSEEELEG